MQTKCLGLIDKLKLEADTLTKTEKDKTIRIKFNQENWRFKVIDTDGNDGVNIDEINDDNYGE